MSPRSCEQFGLPCPHRKNIFQSRPNQERDEHPEHSKMLLCVDCFIALNDTVVPQSTRARGRQGDGDTIRCPIRHRLHRPQVAAIRSSRLMLAGSSSQHYSPADICCADTSPPPRFSPRRLPPLLSRPPRPVPAGSLQKWGVASTPSVVQKKNPFFQRYQYSTKLPFPLHGSRKWSKGRGWFHF